MDAQDEQDYGIDSREAREETQRDEQAYSAAFKRRSGFTPRLLETASPKSRHNSAPTATSTCQSEIGKIATKERKRRKNTLSPLSNSATLPLSNHDPDRDPDHDLSPQFLIPHSRFWAHLPHLCVTMRSLRESSPLPPRPSAPPHHSTTPPLHHSITPPFSPRPWALPRSCSNRIPPMEPLWSRPEPPKDGFSAR